MSTAALPVKTVGNEAWSAALGMMLAAVFATMVSMPDQGMQQVVTMKSADTHRDLGFSQANPFGERLPDLRGWERHDCTHTTVLCAHPTQHAC